MLANFKFQPQFFSKPEVSSVEKFFAAENLKKFTCRFPILFPNQNITRKMHILSFVLPNLIENDTSDNMTHKYLKVEQAGERFYFYILQASQYLEYFDKE